jgi:hypothetical protein
VDTVNRVVEHCWVAVLSSFPGPGGHDQRPLAIAERRHHVEDGGGQVVGRGLQTGYRRRDDGL